VTLTVGVFHVAGFDLNSNGESVWIHHVRIPGNARRAEDLRHAEPE
jgi:hypothetical protein